jgi:hypothetical protein
MNACRDASISGAGRNVLCGILFSGADCNWLAASRLASVSSNKEGHGTINAPINLNIDNAKSDVCLKRSIVFGPPDELQSRKRTKGCNHKQVRLRHRLVSDQAILFVMAKANPRIDS